MSELTTAARPYARAAYAYAEEHSEVDQWAQSLGLLAAVSANADMKKILDDPRLNWKQTADILLQVCEGELNSNEQNFVRLVAQRSRIELLPEIAALFQYYRSRAEGTVQAEVISAKEISSEQLDAISKSLENRLGKKVSVVTSIDATLLGGAVIKAGDLVIDGSIKGRLEKLENAMIN